MLALHLCKSLRANHVLGVSFHQDRLSQVWQQVVQVAISRLKCLRLSHRLVGRFGHTVDHIGQDGLDVWSLLLDLVLKLIEFRIDLHLQLRQVLFVRHPRL